MADAKGTTTSAVVSAEVASLAVATVAVAMMAVVSVAVAMAADGQGISTNNSLSSLPAQTSLRAQRSNLVFERLVWIAASLCSSQ